METNNSLSVFFFDATQAIRIILIENEPWFVSKDVCQVLGYDNSQKRESAIRKLDDEEKLSRKISDSGQMRDMVIINESGLYALILRSNKSEAKAFRKWVTAEVLPQIRKTGSYNTIPTFTLSKELFEEMMEAWLKNAAAKFATQAELEEWSALFEDFAFSLCDGLKKLHFELFDRLDALEAWRRKTERHLAQFQPPQYASVYLLYNPIRKLYKIGQSTQPNNRKKAFQSIEPDIITVCTLTFESVKQAFAMEKFLHDRFALQRVFSEWFDLSAKDVEFIRSLEVLAV